MTRSGPLPLSYGPACSLLMCALAAESREICAVIEGADPLDDNGPVGFALAYELPKRLPESPPSSVVRSLYAECGLRREAVAADAAARFRDQKWTSSGSIHRYVYWQPRTYAAFARGRDGNPLMRGSSDAGRALQWSLVRHENALSVSDLPESLNERARLRYTILAACKHDCEVGHFFMWLNYWFTVEDIEFHAALGLRPGAFPTILGITAEMARALRTYFDRLYPLPEWAEMLEVVLGETHEIEGPLPHPSEPLLVTMARMEQGYRRWDYEKVARH